VAKIFIIAEESLRMADLRAQLSRGGHRTLMAPGDSEILTRLREETPALVIIEAGGAGRDGLELARLIRKKNSLPVIALLDSDLLRRPALDLSGIDDFLVAPANGAELLLRLGRLLTETATPGEETMRAGDLVIDTARCEVFLAGQPVILTFREYELLKFLARDPGRVFTREALLDKVWGYDYYGGDRTVDVHIRRLREKIEDPAHTFIETVRNIGYRFRDGTAPQP